MTDRATYVRRLAALALVPLSAGAFGGGVAWAGSHDPLATSTPSPAPSTPTPVATATVDPQVTAALAEVADAKARIATLQAVLDQRAADAAAAAQARAGAPAPAAKAPAAKAPAAKAPAPAAAAAPAAAPAPVAPPVNTKTKAS